MKAVYSIYFFGCCLLLRLVFAYIPSLTECLYSRGFFVLYRLLWDYTLGWSPFPLVYVFVISGFLWWLYRLFLPHGKSVAHKQKEPTKWILNVIGRFSAVIGFIVGSFLLTWGYNYCRVPFEKQLSLQVNDSIPLEDLRAEARRITAAVSVVRDSIVASNSAYSSKQALRLPLDFPSLEIETRANLEAVLKDLGYPILGAVRGRLLQPAGILLRNNTAGVYLPWTGEGHVDAGLPVLQIPFTLAHELSHGYGFTDEGVCNFLAYLACERSRNLAVRYSGRLAHWRYVFSSLHDKNTAAYLWERAKLPRGVYEDTKAIRKQLDEYPDLLKGMQASTYDSYLKIQGVKEGLTSYERMVILVMAWQKRNRK